MNTETKKIYLSLKLAYNGEPWPGVSLMDILQNVTEEQAFKKPLPNAHSIAELVAHITAWRDFAWKKLSGDNDFDIALNTPEDWPLMDTGNKKSWEDLLKDLEKSQENLLEVLKKSNDEQMNSMVLDRKYSFYFLLHGIIQHDFYHGGQIVMLKKALG